MAMKACVFNLFNHRTFLHLNRTLQGHLEIQKFLFSYIFKDISLVHCARPLNIFQHSNRNFVSPCSQVISFICFKFKLNDHANKNFEAGGGGGGEGG